MANKTYVLIVKEDWSREPKVLAVGTKREVKARAFKLLGVLPNPGTFIPINSQYGSLCFMASA